MAGEAELIDDEIDDEVEVESETEIDDEVEGQDVEGEEIDRPDETKANDNQEGGDDDEVVISFGADGPEDDKPAPEWVRNLRKKDREKDKRIKELEAMLEAKEPAKLAPEPKLEDFDYDEDAYKSAYAEYLNQKQDIDRQAQEKQAQREALEQEFIERQTNYVEAAKSLKVPNYEDAEALVRDVLTDEQRQLIIEGIEDAKDQAVMVYALGRNPEKLQELAKISSLPRFAVALGKIQKDLRVTTRKPKSKPETKPTGGAPLVSGRLQKQLDAARKKAAETGDFGPVMALKRQMKQK